MILREKSRGKQGEIGNESRRGDANEKKEIRLFILYVAFRCCEKKQSLAYLIPNRAAAGG